jgi:putative sugar O-methyltransferase
MPYNLKLEDIREMAYNHCLIQGQLKGVRSIREIETALFGNPTDLFQIDGKKYTMQFLNFYLRYCFAQSYLNLKGDETIVELGSGSGFQIEILKKIHPGLTIICFDLPSPLFLGEQYLKNVFPDQVFSADQALDIQSLDELPKGKICFLGNWQFPLLKDTQWDVFWNAASFGEMEPHIVENYLSYVRGNAKRIYLLQARFGKETGRIVGVEKKIRFEDYRNMLNQYTLLEQEDVFQAHRRLSQSGGYFQGVWEIKD